MAEKIEKKKKAKLDKTINIFQRRALIFDIKFLSCISQNVDVLKLIWKKIISSSLPRISLFWDTLYK